MTGTRVLRCALGWQMGLAAVVATMAFGQAARADHRNYRGVRARVVYAAPAEFAVTYVAPVRRRLIYRAARHARDDVRYAGRYVHRRVRRAIRHLRRGHSSSYGTVSIGFGYRDHGRRGFALRRYGEYGGFGPNYASDVRYRRFRRH